jgi:hypothetical protein
VGQYISRLIQLGRCKRFRTLALGWALLLAVPCPAQTTQYDRELQSLQEERVLLTEELSQFDKTLALLLPDDSRAADSDNPAVKSLAQETTRIRKRLIAVTEREVFLVQKRLSQSEQDRDEINSVQSQTPITMDKNPLEEEWAASESEDVARLLALLNQYYGDLRDSQRTTPSAETLAQEEAAREDALELAKIPFSADKLRLNGAEGFTALARISARLADPGVVETRRDTAIICAIKTRQSGTLIASENRSLRPLGKNQYIARVQLRPGDTSLRVQSHKWELRLPADIPPADYVVTLSLPKAGEPEMHIFSVQDLLAQENSVLPSWLPSELNLHSQSQ